jgi:hypothetical protein
VDYNPKQTPPYTSCLRPYGIYFQTTITAKDCISNHY